MNLHDDFTRRLLIHTSGLPWVDSPMAGVHRRMLDRIGGEVARATSIVRYAPGSRFAPHVHGGGEEFIVLEGVFQDEHADYPAGSYVRNPPTTHHTPRSDAGCTIFVKLWQFDPADREHVVIDLSSLGNDSAVHRLFEDAHETVELHRWSAGESREIDVPDGLECLVLDGGFSDNRETLHRHDWLRLPPGSVLQARAGPQGAVVWMKSRHLRNIRRPPEVR